MPGSYIVNAEGTSYRRNRHDLIKTTEMPNPQQQPETPETNTIRPVQVPTSLEKVSSRGQSAMDSCFGLVGSYQHGIANTQTQEPS